MAPDPVITTLPDGAIRVEVAGRCGTVTSWHLVAGKVAQLQRNEGQAFGAVSDQPHRN